MDPTIIDYFNKKVVSKIKKNMETKNCDRNKRFCSHR